jgi:hypothetical protein
MKNNQTYTQEKEKKTKEEEEKSDWRTTGTDDNESLVFVSPLLAGFVDCACVCTSCYIVR